MIQELEAVFRDGVFVPQGPCALPDQTPVRLIVWTAGWEPAELADADQRRAVIQQMIARIERASVSPDAFPISREELHERR